MLHGSAGWRRELGGVGRQPLSYAWTPVVPFKAKAACRRHIPKQRHRVTNWAEYDPALRARGSLTVWFTDEAIAAWRPRHAPPRRTTLLLRSGDRHGADTASGVPLGAAPDRRADRLHPPATRSRSPVPDHSTLGRRAETLKLPKPRSASASGRCTCWWTAPVYASAARASGWLRSTAPSGAGPGECCILRRTPIPAGSSPRC